MHPFLPTDTNRKSLVIETVAMAGRTGQFVHIRAHLIASEITIGLTETTVNVVYDPFKRNFDIPNSTKLIFIVEVEFFPV